MNIAVITGASSGIGAEFARQLDTYNLDELWLIARRKERMEGLGVTLKTKVRVFASDLTKPESIDAFSAQLQEEKPKISYLVNAAGFGKFGNYQEVSARSVSEMIDLNNKAMVLICLHSLPYMPKGSHILNMCSSSSFQPLPNFNIYAATKVFVLHYCRALRAELKKENISVTAVSPCWVNTEFFSAADSDATDNRPKHFTPMVEPRDVVKRALKDAAKNKALSIYGAFAKMQQIAGKIFPQSFLIWQWMHMQKKQPN